MKSKANEIEKRNSGYTQILIRAYSVFIYYLKMNEYFVQARYVPVQANWVSNEVIM